MPHRSGRKVPDDGPLARSLRAFQSCRQDIVGGEGASVCASTAQYLVWQNQETAKGTTSASILHASEGLGSAWVLRTLCWEYVGFSQASRMWCMTRGYSGLGAGVPLSSWMDRDVAVP